MVILILLILGTIASVGGIIVESVRERSVVKENVTDLIFKIHGKNLKEIRELIEGSRIYTRHKEALFTVLDHGSLPEETLIAAAKRLISTCLLYTSGRSLSVEHSGSSGMVCKSGQCT